MAAACEQLESRPRSARSCIDRVVLTSATGAPDGIDAQLHGDLAARASNPPGLVSTPPALLTRMSSPPQSAVSRLAMLSAPAWAY
jgi:hypothetical protein